MTYDATCPRCEQKVMFEDYYYKRATIYSRCQDCGYVYDHVLRDEYWEDQRLGQVDESKNYHDTTEFIGPGIIHYRTRRGHGVFGSLEWSDPHGDQARRDVHEHNSTRDPQDPDYITEAYVSIYHPGTKRWERTYFGTGVDEGYRYRNTSDYFEQRPLPWGDALKPESERAKDEPPPPPDPDDPFGPPSDTEDRLPF